MRQIVIPTSPAAEYSCTLMAQIIYRLCVSDVEGNLDGSLL